MKLLSERGFNIHMFPMIQKRGRVFEGDYIKRDSVGQVMFVAKEGSRWNLRCYKFMDYLSTKVRQKFDDYMFKFNPELGLITNINDERLSMYNLTFRPDNIYFISDAIKGIDNGYGNLAFNYKFPIVINFKEAAKDLHWEKNHVIEIIKMIGNCRFKTKYHLKSVPLEGNHPKPNFNSSYENFENDFEAIFTFSNEIKDPFTFGVSKFESDKFQINFNTGFGLCFLQNIFTGGYQLIEDDLYKLSESAQLIYRNRFFTYNKIYKTYLNLNWVINFLNIKSKNKTEVKKMYKKIIDELETMNGIEIIRNINNESYEISKGIKPRAKVVPFRN